MTSPLLDVHDLSVRITRDEGVVRPLNGVSFRINTGQADPFHSRGPLNLRLNGQGASIPES